MQLNSLGCISRIKVYHYCKLYTAYFSVSWRAINPTYKQIVKITGAKAIAAHWEHLAGQPSAPEDTHWGLGSAFRLTDSPEVARSSQAG